MSYSFSIWDLEGIRLMKMRGKKEHTQLIATRIQYWDRSFCETPTKSVFIYEPIQPRIVPLKFDTPARSAKQVPSIFLGVIFVNRTHMGKNIKHYPIMSPTVSVNTIMTRSGMPHCTFHLRTNANVSGAITIEISASTIIRRLYSISFRYRS